MAIINKLLNSVRIGEPINTYKTTQTDTSQTDTSQTGGVVPLGGGDGVCLEGYVKNKYGQCVPADSVGGDCPEGWTKDANGECMPGGVMKVRPCPEGWSRNERGECIPGGIKEIDERKPYDCPEGQHYSFAEKRCVDENPQPDTPPDEVWCAKEKQMIPANQWTSTRCSSGGGGGGGGGTDDYTGGWRDPIEDDGGDIGDWYDRFPIDYDPSRFGDYQKWIKGSGYNPLQEIFDKLGIELKDKYKDFFGNYSWFEESLAGTEFDVARKDLTSQLFDLTRGSWGLRQGQGMMSGKPREMERLGMGQVGREFQGMDTAYRKDIFGLRKSFEEDTVNRLLDLMKAGAPIMTYQSDYTDLPSDFQDWLKTQIEGSWRSSLWNNLGDNGKEALWDRYQEWLQSQG